jgi:ATP-dependent DNA helicase RecQ
VEQLLFEGLLREDPNDGRPLVGLGDADGRARGLSVASAASLLQHLRGGRRQVHPQRKRKGRDERGRRRAAVRPAAVRGPARLAQPRRQGPAPVPPYVIFHDRTLIEIAAAKPTSRASLERLNGVGEGKLARYGDAVLEVVRGFEG